MTCHVCAVFCGRIFLGLISNDWYTEDQLTHTNLFHFTSTPIQRHIT